MAFAAFILTLLLCILGLRSPPFALASPSEIVPESVFRTFFPTANSFYTYNDFIAATGMYPSFGSTGGLDDQKRELAAYFAHVKHETGTLQYIEEINKNNDYCDSSPCPAGSKAYYGRGPLQLTWNYNYNAAAMALNANLLENPYQVATDGLLAWKTSVWFWMDNSNCHSAITQNQDFGGTIRAINGNLECNMGVETDPAKSRIQYYQDFCSQLNVAPGDKLSCA